MVLGPDDLQAGRWLFGGDVGRMPQWLLPCWIAFSALTVANGVGKNTVKNSSQPDGQLSVGVTAKLIDILKGLEERLLDDVGRVEPLSQPAVHPATGPAQ